MSFPVDGTIPGPNDDPSISQGEIQTNFANIKGWSAVDHIQYGAINDGKHAQVNFPNVTTQGAQVDPASVLYTKNVNGHPELFFKNSQADLQFVASGQTYTCNLTGPSISPSSFTANYFVGGGITFFFGSVSLSTLNPAGNPLIISLPSTSTFGGSMTVQKGSNQIIYPIGSSASTVTTSNALGVFVLTFWGFYI